MTKEEIHQKRVELRIKLQEKARRKARDYRNFFPLAWDVIEPATPLEWNWHLDYLCDEFQKQAERIARREPKEYDLVINIPPRSLKSCLGTKLLLPYVWSRFPSQRFLTSSFNMDLTLEHAVDSRNVVISDWYQNLWGDKFSFASDMNVKSFYKNTKGGYRICTSVGSSAVGRGGDWIICDDPLSPEEAQSESAIATAKRWWKQTMHTRLNDQKIGVRVIIMQRLSELDLTGVVMEKKDGKYKHICIPALEADNISPPELRKHYVNGMFFSKSESGRFSKEVLANDKEELGEYGFAGQMQQNPAPAEGGIFKRHWWKFWRPPGSNLPNVVVKVGNVVHTCETIDLPTHPDGRKDFDDYICSWDMTFKDLEENDYVAGHSWMSKGSGRFLLDRIKGKLDFPATCRAVKSLNMSHTMSAATIIEDKANGPAVIADLQREVPGLIAITPRGSKHARAMPMARQCEAGNIYLPHPMIARQMGADDDKETWVDALINEFASFPYGANDDDVDAGTQAIDYLSSMKRVVPMFDGQTSNYRINFARLSTSSMLYCSQWVDRDQYTSILLALWNREKGQLYVFDEVQLSNPMPEIVSNTLNALIRRDSLQPGKKTPDVMNMDGFQWFGNAIMFARQTGTMKMNMKEGISESYSRHGLSIQDNVRYDENGAILFLAKLIAWKGLKLHTRCQDTRQQVSSWVIDGDKPAVGYGLARALCSLVSVVWETGTMEPQKKRFRDYSQEKDAYDRAMDLADDLGNLGTFLGSQDFTLNQEEQFSPDGWM